MARHSIRVLGTGATRPRSPPGRRSVDDPDLAAELQMPTATIYNWTCRDWTIPRTSPDTNSGSSTPTRLNSGGELEVAIQPCGEPVEPADAILHRHAPAPPGQVRSRFFSRVIACGATRILTWVPLGENPESQRRRILSMLNRGPLPVHFSRNHAAS